MNNNIPESNIQKRNQDGDIYLNIYKQSYHIKTYQDISIK